MKTRTTHYSYALFVSFFLYIIAFALRKGDGHYIKDAVLFIIFITLFYIFFDKLNLNNFAFFFLGTVMAMHGMGRFGFFDYSRFQFWIFPWDTLTHFFASIAISLALFMAIKNVKMSYGFKIFLVLMASIGIATLGEYVEFFGAIKAPEGRGLFATEAGPTPIPWFSEDYWDTMKDLVINAAGSLVGIAGWHVFRKRR